MDTSLKGVSYMTKWEWAIIIIFVLSFIIGMTFFLFYLAKIAKKKLHVSTYFGLKNSRITFKSFDSFVTNSLFVIPNRKYEVVYRLETTTGKVIVNVDSQLIVETTSRKEGSEVISFKRFQPTVNFIGEQAKTGECSVKVYRRRF